MKPGGLPVIRMPTRKTLAASQNATTIEAISSSVVITANRYHQHPGKYDGQPGSCDTNDLATHDDNGRYRGQQHFDQLVGLFLNGVGDQHLRIDENGHPEKVDECNRCPLPGDVGDIHFFFITVRVEGDALKGLGYAHIVVAADATGEASLFLWGKRSSPSADVRAPHFQEMIQSLRKTFVHGCPVQDDFDQIVDVLIWCSLMSRMASH